jgi:CHAT domain-containing protein
LQAHIWSDKGDRVRALQSFRDAVGTVSELRRAPLGYRLDSTYLADKKDLFSRAIAAAVLADQAPDCCRFMEGIKSRTLTAVLSIPRSGVETRADLDGQFDALTRQLDVIEYQAYRNGWTLEKRSEHQALLQKRSELLERIRISDPRWRRLSQSPPLDLNTVLKVLSERSQAALTLYYDPPDLTGVLLVDKEVRSARLKMTSNLPEKLAEYAKNLQKAQPDLFKHDLSVEFSIEAKDLIPAQLLLRALTARSLVIVPHGVLHLVPWAALVHEGKRLFERLPVGILPNVGSVVTDAPFSKPHSVALLGVARYPGFEALKDLPSTHGEMEDIAGLYRVGGVAVRGPWLDADATEGKFWTITKSVSGPGNLLHLSCHGTIVPNEPMSSGLLLFDAKLDAAEVARNALPFDEVVLSACSTGWRPTQVDDIVLTADEILGIPAGFLEAGAKAVLVSIPRAEGKAARTLTTHYHQARREGETPLRALQSAQRHMLDSGAAPGTWVGFSLYGCV